MPIFVDQSFIKLSQKDISGKEQYIKALNQFASRALLCPLLSVSYHKGPFGGMNDYCSQGPYWWPNEQGEYVRRDGHINPNRFCHHYEDMKTMADNVLILAQAGYYLNSFEHTNHALDLLNAWFINSETRMNPHLEYGQHVPGVCTGRFFGIIDTTVLLKVVHATIYLSDHIEILSGLHVWFSSYLQWLMNSEFGQQEKECLNNHGTWWHVQTAAFAAFTGAWEIFDQCLSSFIKTIMSVQISEGGEFVHETTRADALFYSLYNLEAYTLIAELAEVNRRGVSIWNTDLGRGRNIRSVIDYLIPFLISDKEWPYSKVAPLPEALYPLQIGSIRLHSSQYKEVNLKLMEKRKQMYPSCMIGPLFLLPGYFET